MVSIKRVVFKAVTTNQDTSDRIAAALRKLVDELLLNDDATEITQDEVEA